MKKLSLLFFLLLALSASGCYDVRLSDVKPGSVYCAVFRNDTFYRTFDETLNVEIRRLLARNSVFTVASSPRDADYVLQGTILSLSRRVIQTGKEDIPLEYAYECKIAYLFTDRDGRNTGREGGRVTLRRSWRYLPAAGETQDDALRALAVFIAEEIVRDLQKKW